MELVSTLIASIAISIAALFGHMPEPILGGQPALTVPQGGTGWSAIEAGTIPYGTGSSLRLATTSTTTASCSGSTSCSSFTIFGSSPVTISSSAGGGSGTVSTSTNETAGNLAYFTSNSGTPALLGQTATGTISAGTGISLNATRYAVGGALQITNSGVTALGALGQQLTGSLLFATSSTAYNGLTASTTITCATLTCTFANTLSGVLGVAAGGTGATSLNDLIALGTHTVGNYIATLSSSGSITVGGSGSETAAATVNLNMANANSWTALQSFLNSSSTLMSVFNTAYFGGTATSTFNSAGALTLATPLAVTSGGTGLTTFGGVNTVLFTTAANALSSAASFVFNSAITAVGIGTSTPRWPLTVASSTGPQIGIVDGSLTSIGWSWRNITGNLYLASTSAATFATSTTPIISISSVGTTTFSGPYSATSTIYVNSTGSGKGGAIILEDQGGGACTQIVTKAGTVSGSVVTCPP